MLHWLFIAVSLYFAGSTLFEGYKRRDVVLVRSRHFYRSLRFKQVLAVFGLVTVPTLLLAFGLYEIGGPMQWSWTHLLGSDKSQNLAVSGASVAGPIVFALFLAALIVLLPHLAYIEEEIFRQDKHGLTERIIASLLFGLVHLVVGIPVAVALALAWSGFVFSEVYTRTYHKHKAQEETEHKKLLAEKLARAGQGENFDTYWQRFSEVSTNSFSLREKATNASTRWHLAHNAMILIPFFLLTSIQACLAIIHFL